MSLVNEMRAHDLRPTPSIVITGDQAHVIIAHRSLPFLSH